MPRIPKLGRIVARERGVEHAGLYYATVEWIDEDGIHTVSSSRAFWRDMRRLGYVMLNRGTSGYGNYWVGILPPMI